MLLGRSPITPQLSLDFRIAHLYYSIAQNRQCRSCSGDRCSCCIDSRSNISRIGGSRVSSRHQLVELKAVFALVVVSVAITAAVVVVALEAVAATVAVALLATAVAVAAVSTAAESIVSAIAVGVTNIINLGSS